MKLEKTKIVRGSILYQLGNKTYIDKPQRCYTTTMYYDKESNITYIKVHRMFCITEVLCALIILSCLTTYLFYDSKGVVINCTKVATYYDNILYINFHNDVESEFTVNCYLCIDGNVVEARALMPGEIWISTNLEKCPDDCYMKIYYESPIIQPSEIIRLSVIDWS